MARREGTFIISEEGKQAMRTFNAVVVKEDEFGRTVAVVPNHKELKLGTLRGILKTPGPLESF